jgi:hypothetical protein
MRIMQTRAYHGMNLRAASGTTRHVAFASRYLVLFKILGRSLGRRQVSALWRRHTIDTVLASDLDAKASLLHYIKYGLILRKVGPAPGIRYTLERVSFIWRLRPVQCCAWTRYTV